MDVNDLQSELTAMHRVAEALSGLDAPTQARVLRWMHERFQAGVPAPSPAPIVQPHPASSAAPALRIVAPQAVDEALSVTWDEIVNPARSPSAAATPSVTGLLHEFVTEFQDIAREWDAACAAPADADDSEPVLSAAS